MAPNLSHAITSRQDAGSMTPPAPIHGDPVAAIVTITVIMFVVVTTKIGLGALARKRASPRLGLGFDDIFAFIGMALVVAVAGVLIQIFHQSGLITGPASPAAIQAPELASKQFTVLIAGNLPNGFAKLSILCLLLRLFPRTARPITSYFIWFGIAIVSLFYAIALLYIGIHCGPYRGATIDVCPPVVQVDYAKGTSSINLILDVYILVIAAVNVAWLRLRGRERVGVVVVFLTGILALVCSIVTLYYRVVTTTDPGAVWTQVLVPYVLVIYEPAIALITACLPSAPTLWLVLKQSRTFASARRSFSRFVARGSKGFGSHGQELEDRNTMV